MATRKPRKQSIAAEKKEMARLGRHIKKLRDGYPWEQKMESKLLQMYFLLEEWFEEWQKEMKKRKTKNGK